MKEEQQKTVFVTGAGGQLGREIEALTEQHRDARFVFLTHQELDIGDEAAVRAELKPGANDVIINAAAYTAVDRAEQESTAADEANHLGPKHLAALAKETGSLLLHVSTDYVFDGELSRPYREDDATGPRNVYGLTKLRGEEAIIDSGAAAIIVRTSWVYSRFGSTFVNTMLRLGQERDEVSVVFEQTGSPTYARDLADVLLAIAKRLPASVRLPQVYHYANEGNISWYDFAQAIMELGDRDCAVLPIQIEDYPVAAVRPVNSALNKSKLKRDLGLSIPYWKDSLRECLAEIRRDASG